VDLRSSFPRSMREQLAGYVHLPRMIDKCRAVLAGTEGEYIYPCPLDLLLLDFAGITAEQFTAAVKSTPTDDGMAHWFRRNARPHSTDERLNWNETLLAHGPSTSEQQASFNKLRDAVDSSRTDVTSWAHLQDLEEGRMAPTRKRVL
jgi:hypothetical protein